MGHYGPYSCDNVIPELVWNRVNFKMKKNCQRNPPGSFNVFYILVIQTDNAQVIFVLIEFCQPGGAAIKLGVTKGFFKVKVLSDFDFGQFLRN